MKTIKTYDEFNFRRYGNPWVAKVDNNGKIDFSAKVGGYTGAYNKGEAGELYISNPVEGQVYAYGQKDYRGNNSGYEYTVYESGEFKRIEKTELSAYLNKPSRQQPVSDAELYAERELRRMKLESQNVPDYSNRGPYGGDQ